MEEERREINTQKNSCYLNVNPSNLKMLMKH